MSVNINPTCATGCTNAPPPVSFDYCQPTTGFGEISYVYATSAATNTFLMDWEDLVEWTARLHQTAIVGTEIRKLTVMGSKAAPEYNDIEMSLNRTLTSNKKHSIAFKIDEIGDANYNFLRSAECGTQQRIWYEDSAGYLYGGDAGILVYMKLDHIIPENSQELQYFEGTASWEAKFHPERIVSPMA